MSLLMLCTSDIYVLINYLSFAQWLWTGLVILGLLVLRRTRPDLHRPIRVPLVCPIIFLICSVFLTVVPVFAEPFETGMVLLIMLAGLPVYLVFFYKSKKGRKAGQETFNGKTYFYFIFFFLLFYNFLIVYRNQSTTC